VKARGREMFGDESNQWNESARNKTVQRAFAVRSIHTTTTVVQVLIQCHSPEFLLANVGNGSSYVDEA
jgi:hypothetical protein